MSRQLWGCYAVADHLVQRAFVADVLLYERLVIPVPPSNEPKQQGWEEHWKPDRQQRLLAIMAGIAEPVPWSDALRKEWQERWSASAAAGDVQNVVAQARGYPGGVSPEAANITRQIISADLARKVFAQPDIRALAVYADAAKFDSEWRIDRAFPFIRRRRRVLPAGPEYEPEGPRPAEEYRLAKILVGRFAIPEEAGRTDEEMLQKAVDVAGDPRMTRWRSEFHAWLSDIAQRELRDQTIVREMAELVEAYNRTMRRRRNAVIFRQSATVVETAAGAGAAVWGGPLAAAAAKAPVAAVADIIAERISGEPEAAPVYAGALLAEARKRM